MLRGQRAGASEPGAACRGGGLPGGSLPGGSMPWGSMPGAAGRGQRLADGAAGAPVDAGLVPGHERLVDQVPAQGAVVVEDRLEDLVDRGF
jgi:hypothetical protein